MQWTEYASAIMFVLGFFGGIVALIYGLSNMEYEQTRPHAGWHSRTRKKKDGLPREETYYSRGIAGTKATLPQKANIGLWMSAALIFCSLFVEGIFK